MLKLLSQQLFMNYPILVFNKERQKKQKKIKEKKKKIARLEVKPFNAHQLVEVE